MSTSRFVPLQSISHFHKVLVVIKQTAYEEYSQLRLRGKAPKALRWKRLENRYRSHKSCVNSLEGILRYHNVDFQCVNRVELDRQHLANVDLIVSVGGDGTVLSSAHFLVCDVTLMFPYLIDSAHRISNVFRYVGSWDYTVTRSEF